MVHAPVRRAEIVAALSLATDLAIGQPLEFALKSCALSLRLADAIGASAGEASEIFYQALLRYIGCNADTYVLAALFGDEMALRRDIALIDLANQAEVAQVVVRAMRRSTADASLPATILGIIKGLALGQTTTTPVLTGHCEVAERIGARLGLGPVVVRNLGQLYERWDGRGLPRGLKGEAVAPAVRVVTLAQDTILLAEAHGLDAALAIVRKRRGKAYEPALADRLLTRPDIVGNLGPVTLEEVLNLEPKPHVALSEAELEEACLIIADVADMRTPFTAGHSRAVAALAESAARSCGLPEQDVTIVRRAGLVHDIGEVAVPTSIWIRPGPLSEQDWERIRLHPYYTERILARPHGLAEIAAVAGRHHERLDGSGYHRGARAGELSAAARILAAAEFYQTKREARPHRPALSADAAAGAMKQQVRAGGLDTEAAAAVLSAAGHRVTPIRRQLVADLTPREVEVLRLIAQGKTTKELAAALGISPKTADNHIQSLYGKIGVTTRAGAALFAVEHGLVTK